MAPGKAGFTVLELLVVLVIMGMMAILVPSVLGAGGRVQLQGAARTLAARAATLRDRAVRERRVTVLSLTADMPAGTSLSYLPGMAPLIGDTTRLAFYPDGSSTGGVITLVRGERSQRIRINMLTGRVALDE